MPPQGCLDGTVNFGPERTGVWEQSGDSVTAANWLDQSDTVTPMPSFPLESPINCNNAEFSSKLPPHPKWQGCYCPILQMQRLRLGERRSVLTMVLCASGRAEIQTEFCLMPATPPQVGYS